MTAVGTNPDLRSAMALLREHGELADVTGEVHWDRELGTVTREALRRKGPALQFTNITDYNDPDALCSKLVTNLLVGHRKIGLLLGLGPDATYQQLIQHVIEKNNGRVAPVTVDDAAVHENVVTGDDIDLWKLPVPHWLHLDGGRYINTFAAVVTKDPDDGWVNLGVYRGMIAEKDRISVLLVAQQHWGLHFAKYRERNEPMPVACVYGWHPVMDFLAGSPLPAGVPEYDVMGAYLDSPVELVRCKTVDLEVPASAEIVVEGFISPDTSEFRMEGPYGEFSGYVSDVPTNRHTIQVTAITHRDEPVFRGTLEGSLPGSSSENSYMSSVQRAAIAWQVLKNNAVPGIKQVFIHPVTNGTHVVVQIKKMSEGHPKQVAMALWSTGAALYRYKHVIVVDDDVDPSDYSAIDWAIAYRVRAGTDDLVVMPGLFGSPIDPSTPLEDRNLDRLGTGIWNRVLIDATKTWRYEPQEEWLGERFPPTVQPHEDDERRVMERWSSYGFDGWDGE